ncbi:(2Fe-2S) ferredoxin domain-containing protein [Roseospirillum parvum]|uniref:(2Fe-2S) ferredoxin n=1 Tax=Roseospirillum parvum TaxID=83401 RepID=A0A1G7XT89_9PROT|nr:(2Fe-2S) ferredoxin domain-containing protein [Roseospirillum parvum]SDG87435.1 hypothetical protein SAMN05421742_10390 [Roseospirillum parvum]
MSPPPTLLVCTNRRFGADRPSCAGRGSEKLLKRLRRRLAELGRDEVVVEESPCFGHCRHGPNARLLGGAFSHRLSADDPDAVIASLDSPPSQEDPP